MKSLNKIIPGAAAAIVALAFGTASAHALNLTISDNNIGTGSGFSGGPRGQGLEDNEAEAGMVQSQAWDLEAFTLNGSKLKVYSGFNLLGGEQGYALGDIFIDVNGNAKYGAAAGGLSSNADLKYDYVIHFNNRSGQTIGTGYEVFSLTENSSVSLTQVGVPQNQSGGSNPFSYVSGGTSIGTGTFGVSTVSGDITLEDGTTVTGGNHYIGEVDLGFLAGTTTDVLFHLALGCGNDNLIGKTSGGFDQVPDVGSTLVLMGFGMSGLAMARGRFNRKSRS